MKKLIILVVLIATAVGAKAQNEAQTPVISVTGEGTVKVVPDEVVIKSRIEHEGDSAEEVKKQNDEVVNAVIKYLKKQGVSEKDIKTDYINLNKRYDYNKDERTFIYVANQAISITLRELDDYGRLMRGLLENGLNRIDGVQFKSSQLEEHKTEARKLAIKNAKRKAEEFAGALDQEPGKAIKISEIERNDFQPVYRMEMAKASDGGGQETIAPGEMEVNVKVNVEFKLD